MSNEIIFLAITAIGSALIIFSLRLGKEAVVTAVAVNLILVSAVGAELISLAGAVTNTGNVFAALAFFALAIVNEFYGKKSAHRAVWTGLVGVVIFVLMTQFTIKFGPSPFSLIPHDTLRVVFDHIPRIAIASLLAYTISAYLNVWLYDLLRRKKPSFDRLWSRYLGAAFVTQIVDSILFFTIAFVGLMPFNILFEIMAIGFISKFIVAVISTPFLYWSRKFVVKES